MPGDHETLGRYTALSFPILPAIVIGLSLSPVFERFCAQ
jgi:hypothetical protein